MSRERECVVYHLYNIYKGVRPPLRERCFPNAEAFFWQQEIRPTACSFSNHEAASQMFLRRVSSISPAKVHAKSKICRTFGHNFYFSK